MEVTVKTVLPQKSTIFEEKKKPCPSNTCNLYSIIYIYIYIHTVVAKIIRTLVFSPAKNWF